MSNRYIFVTGADVADVDAASHQASARYRILLPGRALRDDGVRVTIWPLSGAPDPAEIGPGDCVTVMQLKADSNAWLIARAFM